jgi:hypothetical protein
LIIYNSLTLTSPTIMPPFRNPFVKKPPIVNGFPALQYENSASPTATATANEVERGSPRADYTESRASSSLSIKKREEPGEYKLSGASLADPVRSLGNIHNGGAAKKAD